MTEEEKREYGRLAEEFRTKTGTKKTGAKLGYTWCQGCASVISIFSSHVNGHPLFCTKRCVSSFNRKKLKLLPAVEKKKARQIKRLRRLEVNEFYDSSAWRELRFKALRKYEFKCMACGESPPRTVLHVDHIKPRSKYPELELSFDNLQILCVDCNIGKNNYSEEDLRPK